MGPVTTEYWEPDADEIAAMELPDIYLVPDFLDRVRAGCFTNDDGIGYYLAADRLTRIGHVDCRALYRGELPPSGAVYVDWYNK